MAALETVYKMKSYGLAVIITKDSYEHSCGYFGLPEPTKEAIVKLAENIEVTGYGVSAL